MKKGRSLYRECLQIVTTLYDDTWVFTIRKISLVLAHSLIRVIPRMVSNWAVPVTKEGPTRLWSGSGASPRSFGQHGHGHGHGMGFGSFFFQGLSAWLMVWRGPQGPKGPRYAPHSAARGARRGSRGSTHGARAPPTYASHTVLLLLLPLLLLCATRFYLSSGVHSVYLHHALRCASRSSVCDGPHRIPRLAIP